MRLVGDEEVVQVPADEPTAGRLLHDDVDDVFAVETALVAEEHLLAVIVIRGAILELPREPAIGCPRNLGLEGPAGERPRAFADIGLGVVAGAEAEQLEQFAAPILVDRGAMVLLVVEPEDHRRISCDFEQQLAVVAHAVFAEQLDLFQQLVVVVDLGIAGREDMVPEQRHLLFERPLGIDQIVHPVDVAHRRLAAGQKRRRLVAQQGVGIDRRLGLGMQQFFDRRLVPLGRPCFELVATGAETRSPHQVSH